MQPMTDLTYKFIKLGDYQPTLPEGEERPFFYMIAGYKYRSRAVVSDEPTTGDGDADQVQLVDGEQLRGEAGTRLPRAWVRLDGERVSTLDLLGAGLGLRLFTGAAAAGSVSAALGIPIEVYRIGPEEVIEDLERQWAQRTRLAPDAALLARPDDFISWRADSLPASPADELHKVIQQILGRA